MSNKTRTLVSAILQYIGGITLIILAAVGNFAPNTRTLYYIIGALFLVLPTVSLIRYFVSGRKKDKKDDDNPKR